MFRTKYTPVYTPPEERDFLSYLDDLKYEQTVKNTDEYFQKSQGGEFRHDPSHVQG